MPPPVLSIVPPVIVPAPLTAALLLTLICCPDANVHASGPLAPARVKVPLPTSVIVLELPPTLTLPPNVRLPPPLVRAMVGLADKAMLLLMSARLVLLLVMLPLSVKGLPTRVKALAPELKVMPAKVKPFWSSVNTLPFAPAAPKKSASPESGGLLALPLVQLPLPEKLAAPLPPCQISLPVAAEAGQAPASSASTASVATRSEVGMVMFSIDFIFVSKLKFCQPARVARPVVASRNIFIINWPQWFPLLLPDELVSSFSRHNLGFLRR